MTRPDTTIAATQYVEWLSSGGLGAEQMGGPPDAAERSEDGATSRGGPLGVRVSSNAAPVSDDGGRVLDHGEVVTWVVVVGDQVRRASGDQSRLPK